MVVLDTDILTLLFAGHEKVQRRIEQADDVRITTISRFEILRGRFDALLKAANPKQLLEAAVRLAQSEQLLAEFAELGVEGAASRQFGLLQTNRKLK